MNKKQLREAFAKLPPIDGVPKAHTWDRHRYELRRHVANDNIDDFLRWSTIQATMFVGNAPYVKQELADLPDELYNAIHEPWVGNPSPLPHAPFTSGNMVHQATHLRMLLETTDIDVADLRSVVEFGGGYGALAFLFDRLGFGGIYTIIDLPELALLQEYYARNCGINILALTEIGSMELVDLFIACYSISEAPQETRDFVLDNIIAKYYLFAIQDVYAGLDLIQEFERITKKMTDVKWTWIQNPYFAKHKYIVGERG